MTIQGKTEEKAKQVRVETDRTQGRRRRGVFNGQRLKLEVLGKEDGYKYSWLNDENNRITLAQQGGWEFVQSDEVELSFNNVTPRNSDEGTRVKTLVGTATNGEPLFAYLMRIKQEWYDEDKRESDAYLDRIDEQIKGGNIDGTVGSNGRYIPSQGITIKR